MSEDLAINGRQIHLSMLHNPSHLEAVNPVSMGKTRSKQQYLCDGAFAEHSAHQFESSVINVQVKFMGFRVVLRCFSHRLSHFVYQSNLPIFLLFLFLFGIFLRFVSSDLPNNVLCGAVTWRCRIRWPGN